MTEYIKVVINNCYGGFGLSKVALEMYNKLTGKNFEYYWYISRTDPILIKTVEEMGDVANDKYSCLHIVKVPAYMKDFYEITEYDGLESVVLLRDKYKVSEINRINNSDIDATEKKNQINSMIQKEIDNVIDEDVDE